MVTRTWQIGEIRVTVEAPDEIQRALEEATVSLRVRAESVGEFRVIADAADVEPREFDLPASWSSIPSTAYLFGRSRPEGVTLMVDEPKWRDPAPPHPFFSQLQAGVVASGD